MLKQFSRLLLLIAVSSVFGTTVAGHTYPTPDEVVESTAMAVTERIDGRAVYYDENPAELYALVDELLLPHFDVRYAGRLVLGKYWKTVTPDQRDRFVDVFYRFLLQSYANGILEFEQGSVKVIPSPDDGQGKKRVVVKTETRTADGNDVPINYSMRKTSSGWRVYDVRIEGVSYVQNYRNQFNAEIAATGIDAVIGRLNDKVDAAGIAE